MSNSNEERYGRLLSPPPPNNLSHGKLGLEEALEVKSLRRIISAYLNYSDAAEEDVQRYETCYRKLPPDHQALLSHLPSKFQRLRRCISVNSFFILNMIQAFDPPLDMSQDVDICECRHLEDVPKDCLSGERSFFSEHPSSTSGRTRPFEADQTICVRQSDPTCKALIKCTTNEEVPMISEIVTGGLRVSSEYRKEPESADANDVMVLNNGTVDSSTADSNGNVVAVVKSCRPNGFGDLILTLKDPSGTVNANVHRKVLKESQYGADITVESVFILHKVAVFSSRRAHCLNITLNNVVKVIRKDSGPPPTKEQAPSPVGFAVSGAGECRDTRAGMVDKAAFTKWRVAERLMSAAVKRHTNSQGSVEENQQLEMVNPVEQSSSCKFKRSLVEVEALLVSQGAHRRHATRTGPTDGNEQMADNEDLSLAGASLKKFNFSKSIPQEFSAATKLSAHHTDFMSQGSERGAANAMSIDTIDGVDKQMVGNENIPSAVASLENSNLCESEHQHSSAATNFVDQHACDGEPGRTNGVVEQMQQLPIWTDEQLGELFEDL